MICIGLHSRDMSSVLISNRHVREDGLLVDIRMYTEASVNRSERFGSMPGPSKRGPTNKTEVVLRTSSDGINVEKGITNKTVVRLSDVGPRCYN